MKRLLSRIGMETMIDELEDKLKLMETKDSKVNV